MDAVMNHIRENLTADDVGAISQNDLQEATNEALAQAKASGEFNGKDGKDGKDGYTPIKGVDYFDGQPGKDGADGKDGTPGKDGTSATHSWNGTVLTVTSASGTSSADLKGAKGDKGDSIKGDKGDTGADGVSISSVKQTTTSSADGGSNVVTVTLSNGTTSTFTVKNGSKGSAGTNGTNGKDGKTPVKGTDYWTAADQESMIQDVISALGGSPIFGVVDANNNIVLSGNLAEGTYTLKYEDADGNVTEIGTVIVGETMPDSGSIELEWSNGVKLDKNTGAEGTGEGYAASQHIELVDGYTYTFNQNNAYGGVNICYYDANGTGLGYELLWDSKQGTYSKALTPIDGAATFRIRMYCGSDYSILTPEYFTVTYEKTA